MGIAASAVVVLLRKYDTPKWLAAAVTVTLLNAAALDLLVASRLKAGHVVGFFVGLVCAVSLVPKIDKVMTRYPQTVVDR